MFFGENTHRQGDQLSALQVFYLTLNGYPGAGIKVLAEECEIQKSEMGSIYLGNLEMDSVCDFRELEKDFVCKS